eukprot:2106504-Pleurochrysis_carterae.AAC.2
MKAASQPGSRWESRRSSRSRAARVTAWRAAWGACQRVCCTAATAPRACAAGQIVRGWCPRWRCRRARAAGARRGSSAGEAACPPSHLTTSPDGQPATRQRRLRTRRGGRKFGWLADATCTAR